MHADGGLHKEQVHALIDEFNDKHENIKIKLVASRGAYAYSRNFERWLKEGEGPDIVWWFGGSRVEKHAKIGQLQELTDFWQSTPNRDKFPSVVLNAAKYNGKIFALPISYTLYSLHYRKSVFEKLNIALPQTWPQLLASCAALSEQNKSLFALGTKNSQWILHSWFDYLNLRLHGLAYYQKLQSGQLSFLDDRVRTTLIYFKTLVDNQCFNQSHASLSTWDAFPSILRGYSAMILASSMPEKVHFKQLDDIGLIQFPEIVAGIPKYTVTPVDVFVVPYYAKLTAELETVLAFLLSEKFQLSYVNRQQHMPAIMIGKKFENPLMQAVTTIVENSPGGTQYFDRDVNIDFSGQTPIIFAEFIEQLDIDATMNKLEQLRLQVFGIKH